VGENDINGISERTVRLETVVEGQTSSLARIENKIDALGDKFVSKEIFIEISGGLQKQINEMREDKKTHKNILPVWIAIVPTTIMVVIEIINLLHK